MFHALLVLAAEEAEPSKTPFYIVGGAWAAWAVVLSVLGMRLADFPKTPGAARAVMGISGLLMVAAMATAVVTS